MSVPDVANSISGAIFMQGPGGLLAVPLVQRYGRLPVLFWSQFLTLVCTIGAYGASSYAGFTACRTLQGFFGAPPQVIGLSMIHDMFFFHERARKINIWAFSFLIGPYLGPFIAGFIAEKLDWRNNFGVLAGFYGLSVLLIICFGDETLFDREHHHEAEQSTGIVARISKLTGLYGLRRTAGKPGLWEVTKDLFGLLARPYLLLPSKCSSGPTQSKLTSLKPLALSLGSPCGPSASSAPLLNSSTHHHISSLPLPPLSCSSHL
jgi:MFS family permease